MAKILIVDDSPTTTFTLRKLLEGWGHQVFMADSGDQALVTARQEHPSVILMDIVMPGMSGFQATRNLARDPGTSDIPVIFVTKKDGDADKQWGMRQGAVAYVTKPINAEMLQIAIGEAIAA
jgi:twitching motility two-component system response regulator PilH